MFGSFKSAEKQDLSFLSRPWRPHDIYRQAKHPSNIEIREIKQRDS
jgi:hypothetical protein